MHLPSILALRKVIFILNEINVQKRVCAFRQFSKHKYEDELSDMLYNYVF